MKYYLKDIITRLQKYSATLDQESFLVDKPWVVSNSDEKFEKLIFKRDGSVIFSINGDVTIGKWEYLPEAQALLVDYGEKKKLYRHQFMDEAILALKIDGTDQNDEDFYLLANENLVQDHDAKKYLLNKFQNISSLGAENEQSLPINLLKSNLKRHSSGLYMSTDEKTLMLIRDGKIITKRYLHTYDNGIKIWQKISVPTIDDVVESKGQSNISVYTSDHGTFKITTNKNGVISKVEDQITERILGTFVLAFIMAACIFLLLFVIE